MSGRLASMRMKSDRHRVVLVASPGVPVFELSIACEIFGIDRADIAADWYDFELVATESPTEISLGIQVPQGRGVTACVDADTVIVPACANVHAGAPPELLDALRAAHARGARIVSLCSGAFVLAEAGLLDGRRATTHWMHADELARRYPTARIDPGVLYVHDGLWTSAGSGAALDLCLEIVRQDHGAAAANEVARRVVVPPHRQGGQAQYIRPRPAAAASGLSDVQEWARRNLGDMTVAGLARHAGVSVRTLNRQFRRATGTAPQEWLQRERVFAAQELLEVTTLTVDAVAARVGLGTATNLRVQFSTTMGTTPGAYRKTFTAQPA